MEERLRIAIAGTGFIGAVHARAARLAGARIVGVSASGPERAAAAAAELGAERAFATSEELVEADDVDVVHVCTPNHLHLPLAEAALAAGKHVVCEKPLAVDAAGAARLVEAAERAERRAAVPFVYRYYPTVREARERIRSGASGDVRLIHGSYLQDWLLSPADDNWRVDAALGGSSRAFADIGSHWCDLVEFVTGHRIGRLSARIATTVPERSHRPVSTEDAALVQFETAEGALGSVVISQVAPGRKNRLWFEIDAAEEALAFDQESPEALWCGRREAATVVRRDPEHLSPAAARVTTLPAGHPEGYAHCFDRFVADFYASLADGTRPDGLPGFDAGLRAAQITEAVLASAHDERWVDVPAAAAAEVSA